MADYESLDLNEMQQEYQRVSSQSNANNSDDYLQKFVRMPDRDGFVLMRILPRKKGGKHYCATRTHTLNNPTTNKKRAYHCPKVLVHTDKGPRWQGDCIICKYYSDTWQKSEALNGKAKDDLQNQAREIKPVERYYYNVIVRSEKDFKTNEIHKNVGPKIFSCGKTTHARILRAMLGDESTGEEALGDITHPINGRDFKLIKKVVKGGGGSEYPNYDQSKFEGVSPAGSPENLKTWIENLHDLQALRSIKTPDELKHALRVHLGMVKEGDSEEDDDLSEFRSAKREEPSSTVSNTVREELAVTTSSTNSYYKEEEQLADEDFMSELAGL